MEFWLPLLGFVVLIVGVLASSFTSSRTSALDKRLARVERQLTLIMRRLEIEEPETPLTAVVAEIEQGRKIQAIKLYREQTGAGLAEAKEAVETMARERGL
ncbi:ribosomal protein L7/L12 [Actinomadura sp. DC4]|uniref:ribosomal protein L7/L12 n=1 Tax=Actinomadura sp. DC4 TaxID=3055069 RepID=UPI0025B04208|nr:ribosomal protein L7/L12 [Actinomadura sp. DC4]MDN3353393.1 ribosomal protein L7/L12 [Actinomadura sp. DC4]